MANSFLIRKLRFSPTTRTRLSLSPLVVANSLVQSIAVDIFQLCARCDIQINVQWIPRNENETADHLSRYVNKDDRSLIPEVFAQFDCRWGPRFIDCFSSQSSVMP